MVALLCLGACVEDNSKEGNNNVNIVTLSIPQSRTIKFFEGTYTLDVSEFIEQTKAPDLSNLKFQWGWSNRSFVLANMSLEEGEIASTDSYVDLTMESIDTFSDFANYYRLRVYDELTGITYHADLSTKVVRPFEGSWMVLHEQGGTKVGAVEFLGTGEENVYTDVFQEYGLSPLTGNPAGLGVIPKMTYIEWPPVFNRSTDYQNLLFVMTDNVEETANYAQWASFTKTRKLADMVANPLLITSGALGEGAYLYGTFYGAVGYLGAIIGGQMYKSKYALRMYQSQPDESSMPGEYYISHGLKVSTMTLGYDRIGRRIVYCMDNTDGYATPIYSVTAWDESKENTTKIKSIKRVSNPENVLVDPIPEDREVVFFGSGPYSMNSTNALYVTSFALAVGVNGNSESYVYTLTDGNKMNATSNPAVLDYYTFDTPEGMDENSCFAATSQFTGFFYYSAGNKIYRYNFVTKNNTLIYEHAAGGAVIAMKFARDQEIYQRPEYESYEYTVMRSLGVAINNGSNGELVILELSEAGALLKSSDYLRPPKSEYAGFGKIKDIVFL